MHKPLSPYQLALAMHAAQAQASGLTHFAAALREELRAELRADLAHKPEGKQ